MNWITNNWKIVGSSSIGFILIFILCALSFFIGTTEADTALNLTMIVFGISLGWLTGIVASPYSNKEQVTFSSFTKAFGAFVSGYLVGKIDKLLESLSEPEIIMELVNGFRVLIAISSFLTAMIMTYVYRKYA